MRWGDRKNASKQENYLKTHKICIFMGWVASWRVYRRSRPECCGQPTVIYAWGDKKLFNWVLHTYQSVTLRLSFSQKYFKFIYAKTAEHRHKHKLFSWTSWIFVSQRLGPQTQPWQMAHYVTNVKSVDLCQYDVASVGFASIPGDRLSSNEDRQRRRQTADREQQGTGLG